jgi:hypothetical protein
MSGVWSEASAAGRESDSGCGLTISRTFLSFHETDAGVVQEQAGMPICARELRISKSDFGAEIRDGPSF